MLAYREVAVQVPSGAEDFFLYRPQTGFGAHTPPYFTFGALLARMWPEIEADYSSSSVEIKNKWRCTSTFHVPSRATNTQLNFDFGLNLIKQKIHLSKICKNSLSILISNEQKL
jgi:hypothetical protein